MARTKPRAYGFVYKKQKQRKRPGRHSKKVNKKRKKRNLEARASRPSQRYHHVLRNLNLGIDLPYNLHTLQPEGMQEKTLVFLVNL